MFDILFASINQRVHLSPKEQDEIVPFFIQKKLKKRQYLLQQDDVAKYVAFVSKGLLRLWASDDKGNEHIVQFALEGWWITDMYSFLTAEPSGYCIDAIEDSELLLLTREANDALLDKVPKMERYFRILTQNSMVSMQRRLMGSFRETAEEKYLKLLAKYPDVVQRVPQHMIASYLGVKPETLSRTRKAIASRK